MFVSLLIFLYVYAGFETLEFNASEIAKEMIDPFKNYAVQSEDMIEMPKQQYLEEINEEDHSNLEYSHSARDTRKTKISC